MERLNLYKVTLIGLSGTQYNPCYVIASDPALAYEAVRKELDDKDYGFRKDRELDTVTLLAKDNALSFHTKVFIP